jgi:hypothetical protein
MVCDLAGAETPRREPENLAMTIGKHRAEHGGGTGRLPSPSGVVPTSPMAIGRRLNHRLPDDVSGGAAEGGEAAQRDWCRRLNRGSCC